MTVSSLRRTQRRRLSWLLWFACVFVFAQSVASAHAISHIGAGAGRARDGVAVHGTCDLCLIGASIAGAAPLPDPLPALPVVHRDVPRDTTVRSAPSGRFDRAYQSRAPPLAPR